MTPVNTTEIAAGSASKTAGRPASPYEKLRGRLWPKGARPDIWAVLDCARDPQMWWMIDKSSLLHECLYAGTLSLQLERAAPYLVQLEFDDERTIRLLDRGWGNNWGILLRTGMSLHALKTHLRRLLLVRVPGGKQLAFRYYDPRVMRAFLPTCAPSQLEEVFGSIERIMTEEADPDRMTEFRFDPGTKVLDSVGVVLR